MAKLEAAVAKRKRPGRSVKTWAQINRLAESALAALEAQDFGKAAEIVKAIRGVALLADEKKL